MISSLVWPLCESAKCSEEHKLAVITKNFIQNKEQFSDDELQSLSVELLNSFLRKDISSNFVKLPTGLTIDVGTYFSLMENLPIMEVFFNPNAMSAMDDQSLCALKDFFSKFIDYITSKPRTMRTEIQFAQFCILSWQECFVHHFQHLIGDVVSDLLTNKITSFLCWYSLAEKVKHDSFSICLHLIVLVSIFRLFYMSLSDLVTSDNAEVESDKKLYPSKSNLNDLGRLYQKSFETLLDSTVKGPILRSNNLEIFVSDAFKLVMHFCGTYEKVTLKELAFDELVPKLQSDPTLHKRLTLGYASFLAQFLNLLPEIDCVLIDSDLHRLQKFVQNLLFVSGQIPDRFSHTDLISWNIDRGLCVKDYALTFLRNSNFDDALCSSKVLVRLNRQLPLLTEDSDVTMAVIRKLNYLRSKMLPVNSHEDLLKELMSVLSPALKTEILDRLHNKSKKPITPLPLEENKFRSYLRNFFNRLSVGPVLSDNQPVSKMCKLWRDNASSNTVSKEVLLSADMLVLTQPLKFLSELVRFPIIQNSMALLPVLYNILNHVSYAFTINIDDNQASILHNLMVSLLEMYDSETPETREGDDGLIWRGANRQRMELMRYLPRSGDLDPEQISLANQAAKFSTSSASGSVCFDLADDDDVNNNKGGGGGEDSMGKSAVRKLWVYAITCFLDQPATWPHLSELVNDESSVLSSRKRAELFTQCLALILLPRPPANIPLDLVAPPCLRLLENLRSPLAVRLCATLLPSTSGVTEALRNVFTDPGDQGRRLFLQSIDCLPVNLVENMIISLPQCLTQSNLVDVNILNKSPKNIYKFFFESQTSTSQPSFAKPISASDFEEVLQLVSLCDSVWNIVVNHILTVANRSPEVCIVWTTLSAPTLILALHTFLHRISLLDQVDSTECWARAMGFVDQLLSGGLIALPFRVRSSNSTVPTSQSVYLGTYRGTLDLFDFTFSLLRLVNVSTFSSTNSHIIIGRLCQTLAVLGQRLITRLRCELHESEAQNPMISTLSQQSILVIAEIRAYIDDQDVPPSSPLKNLVASLDIVESSLSCQREDLEDTKNVPEEEEGGAVDKVPGN